MTSEIRLDKRALREFISLMDQTAEEMADIQDGTTPRYARSGGGGEAAYRNGVKVTVGSVDFAHPGRVAGELMADRIAETLEFVRSLEEGSRALARIVRSVLDDMGARDSIAASDLARINNSMEGRSRGDQL
ncbi:hypothetical protein [Stackebrandtia nassauensis]|uniref:Uncharacterized protein n=1 Tax=Stackebrandtia nassauensis (strain DSM 44728 / CIP 108903 / NRRL B-16338 / NBRC 102104 / LLR-40K-21) TaxID=446470 RepID=D3PTZ8_STANL|nr:hypothetical protein [Stackebrandtia nassauensis]ADD39756.1 hypothetical protein Snas_0034 [Stackebrandtia nassauensis DSM 44728]